MNNHEIKFDLMKPHGYGNILLILFMCFLTFTSCSVQDSKGLKQGILTGKISIGPLCPVEMIPPDPNCLPTLETYKAWPVGIWTVDKKTKIGEIQPNLEGHYDFELLEGSYIVDLVNTHHFGSNLPTTIKIETDETVLLNIDIDTGIR